MYIRCKSTTTDIHVIIEIWHNQNNIFYHRSFSSKTNFVLESQVSRAFDFWFERSWFFQGNEKRNFLFMIINLPYLHRHYFYPIFNQFYLNTNRRVCFNYVTLSFDDIDTLRIRRQAKLFSNRILPSTLNISLQDYN